MTKAVQPPRQWAIARTPEDLGKFVNARRVSFGWTQRDLADHLGFPVRYLHEIESGKDTRAFVRLFDLLRTLGIEVHLEALPDSDSSDDLGDFSDLDLLEDFGVPTGPIGEPSDADRGAPDQLTRGKR